MTLPPLREIKSDIPLLADHFRQVCAQEFKKKVDRIDRAALDALGSWHWPGNVRELRNVIERAMIFTTGPVLQRADLPALSPLEGPEKAGGATTRARDQNAFALPKRLTLADAEHALVRANCRVGTVRHAHSKKVKAGLVMTQSPGFGLVGPRGGRVNLVVSLGKR